MRGCRQPKAIMPSGVSPEVSSRVAQASCSMPTSLSSGKRDRRAAASGTRIGRPVRSSSCANVESRRRQVSQVETADPSRPMVATWVQVPVVASSRLNDAASAPSVATTRSRTMDTACGRSTVCARSAATSCRARSRPSASVRTTSGCRLVAGSERPVERVGADQRDGVAEREHLVGQLGRVRPAQPERPDLVPTALERDHTEGFLLHVDAGQGRIALVALRHGTEHHDVSGPQGVARRQRCIDGVGGELLGDVGGRVPRRHESELLATGLEQGDVHQSSRPAGPRPMRSSRQGCRRGRLRRRVRS